MYNKLKDKILEKGKNTLNSLTDSVKVPQNVAEERWSICDACPHLYRPTSTCKKCGCFMKVKTLLKGSKCPLNKWDYYES